MALLNIGKDLGRKIIFLARNGTNRARNRAIFVKTRAILAKIRAVFTRIRAFLVRFGVSLTKNGANLVRTRANRVRNGAILIRVGVNGETRPVATNVRRWREREKSDARKSASLPRRLPEFVATDVRRWSRWIGRRGNPPPHVVGYGVRATGYGTKNVTCLFPHSGSISHHLQKKAEEPCKPHLPQPLR